MFTGAQVPRRSGLPRWSQDLSGAPHEQACTRGERGPFLLLGAAAKVWVLRSRVPVLPEGHVPAYSVHICPTSVMARVGRGLRA